MQEIDGEKIYIHMSFLQEYFDKNDDDRLMVISVVSHYLAMILASGISTGDLESFLIKRVAEDLEKNTLKYINDIHDFKFSDEEK